MNTTVFPGLVHGTIQAIPSKSQAHRLLICAAFSDGPTKLVCPDTNRDIEATADCLNALGAAVSRTDNGYLVFPIKEIPMSATLPCCESGSTLRFMLPIAGALGVDTTFTMEGRLPKRPLSPLWEEMERMGCSLSRPTESTIHCTGKLHPGSYSIDGGVSSQFITGLLFALSLIDGDSTLAVTGKLESKPYVIMTQQALALFGVNTDNLVFHGKQQFRSPGMLTVEGDWSNAAFFLAATALGSNVDVQNVNPDSAQGDRACAFLLPEIANGFTEVDASDIPDLVPILSVAAGACHGAVFHNIARLRLKESDRVASVIAMLKAIGGNAEADENNLHVFGTGYSGGTVDACGDHRIAMAAAIAATVSTEPVTILGSECVAKSYPNFWRDFTMLGGKL